ncbi:HlyD family secretion protein [Prosthecodimorpha staleyi]|uniref:HlyD family secretion protein n=1 Tax=Prosthecodimorpha staleyi TaxID=2840188 RepID=A0A947D593_9HYPH|nr:HlyD family secretion protein [Prosthecodimorpha staleyi]MBT9289826.1 HlyD family secretion protein [Prosthecodimorpha staleyi]
MAGFEGEIAASRSAARRLAAAIETHRVRAPVFGRIGDALPLSRGAYVAEGQRVATIIPEGGLIAVGEFDPAATVGRIRAGQHAVVRLDGFPWTRFGTAPATVTRVASEVRDGRVRAPLGDLDDVLLAFGSALVRTELDGRPALFALVGRRGLHLRLIAPDFREVRVPVARMRDLIAGHLERTAAGQVDRVIERVGIPAERRGIVRRAMLRERLGSVPIAGLWTLRLPPEASLHRHLADAHAYRRLALTVLLLASVFSLEILGWILIGSAVLEGQLNLGWLAAWTLLMLTMVPARAVGEWIAGTLSIDLAAFLKGRLLAGALRFDVDAVRREGAGQLLGRVIEGQAFEAVAIGGGLATLTGSSRSGWPSGSWPRARAAVSSSCSSPVGSSWRASWRCGPGTVRPNGPPIVSP